MTLLKLLRDDRGGTMIEYGLLVSLIACVSAAVMGEFGQKLIGVLNYLLSFLPF